MPPGPDRVDAAGRRAAGRPVRDRRRGVRHGDARATSMARRPRRWVSNRWWSSTATGSRRNDRTATAFTRPPPGGRRGAGAARGQGGGPQSRPASICCPSPMCSKPSASPNRAMARPPRAAGGRRRKGKGRGNVAAPAWRPFQLAYILMNLRGIAEPTHPERDCRRPAVLPHRRRQDRSLPRALRLPRSCSAACAIRPRQPGIVGADALHVAGC